MQHKAFLGQKRSTGVGVFRPERRQRHPETVRDIRQKPLIGSRFQEQCSEIDGAGAELTQPFGGDAGDEITVGGTGIVDQHADITAAVRIPAFENLNPVVIDESANLANRPYGQRRRALIDDVQGGNMPGVARLGENTTQTERASLDDGTGSGGVCRADAGRAAEMDRRRFATGSPEAVWQAPLAVLHSVRVRELLSPDIGAGRKHYIVGKIPMRTNRVTPWPRCLTTEKIK